VRGFAQGAIHVHHVHGSHIYSCGIMSDTLCDLVFAMFVSPRLHYTISIVFD
jgi:hypothetical protein